ncbi:hypothetical protein NGRA_1125 [Nosema granulosis]|uniref:U1-type domain-containing protein n=1 Tax=Nosema granulosis TaxID=83296 RepID=A0A9P6KYY0_9MICR|nr:hypothetical protein NGRA_1125 [Nosema granulosis]
MVEFEELKSYIYNLEKMEKLFLMYEDVKYSEDITKNLTLYFIRKKYYYIYKHAKERETGKIHSLEYYRDKSSKRINRFKSKYGLKDLEFDIKFEEKKANKQDNQIYRLFLMRALKFGREFFRITNLKIYKKVKKRVLKEERMRNIVPNKVSTDTVSENKLLCGSENKLLCGSENKLLCVSCMMEIKHTLIKNHVEGKKHKRMANGKDRIVQIKGDLKKAESLMEKMIKYSKKGKVAEMHKQHKEHEKMSTVTEEVIFEEEFEDDEGNVYDKKTYYDLKRNGLL